MYLPTFWKLTTEAYMYKLRHMVGWGLPAVFMGKDLLLIFNSRLDRIPFLLQLDVHNYHSSSIW